jgi:hypothetical protein
MEEGKYTEAQNLCRRALDILDGISGEDHPKVADVLETLARLNRKTANVAEAARLEQRVKEIRVPKPVAYAPSARALQ